MAVAMNNLVVSLEQSLTSSLGIEKGGRKGIGGY